ncbi:MAG TPA: hypothetical protein VGL58_14460 [Caulobacteraceae bacterium]
MTHKRPALLDRVRRLFDDRREGAPATAAPERIRARPSASPPIAGARFGLVGIADMRDQLGERWPDLSARVHDLTQAVIQRHLGHGDVYDAHGEDGYVILFTQLTEAQAAFKCRVIAKEIAAKLLGADWVGRATQDVIFELPEGALNAPSFEVALDEAIARGRPLAPPPDPRPASVAGEARSAPAAVAPATRAASPAFKPIERQRGAAAAYWPIWDLGAEALLRFRFKPAPLAATTAMDFAKADVEALTQVLFDVGQLRQSGRRLPVTCPVRLSTILQEGRRAQIARMLLGAPGAMRRMVTLEIVVGVDDADWLSALERVWPAMPDAPAVSLPLHAAAMPARGSALVKDLNLALADGFTASKRGIAALEAVAQRADRVGMRIGVSGLRTKAAALAATAAGFRQLSGPVIHAEVASLGHAAHFDLRSLYRDLLPQAG